MIYDLAIVGAGFWGTAVLQHAHDRGMNALLIDCGEARAGSRNAAGIVHKTWFERGLMTKLLPKWWMEECLSHSLDWLTENFGLRKTGEYFDNRTRQASARKLREDCFLLPTLAHGTRYDAAVKERVTRLRQNFGGAVTVECEQAHYTAKSVVLAAGVWTNVILTQSELPRVEMEPLRGRALVFSDNAGFALEEERPVTAMIAPYKSYTLRNWEGLTFRIGDTVERERGATASDKQLGYLRRLMAHYAPNHVEEYALTGERPLAPRFHVEAVADRVIVATGGGRVGLTAAPACGRRAVKLAGRWA